MYDSHTFTLNPLDLVRGLARACEQNRATIFGVSVSLSPSLSLSLWVGARVLAAVCEWLWLWAWM